MKSLLFFLLGAAIAFGIVWIYNYYHPPQLCMTEYGSVQTIHKGHCAEKETTGTTITIP